MWRREKQNKAGGSGYSNLLSPCRCGGRGAPNEERSSDGESSLEARKEGGRKQACPLPHHAPGISYLKFSLSAPQKPFHTVTERRARTHRTGHRSQDAQGTTFYRDDKVKTTVLLPEIYFKNSTFYTLSAHFKCSPSDICHGCKDAAVFPILQKEQRALQEQAVPPRGSSHRGGKATAVFHDILG